MLFSKLHEYTRLCKDASKINNAMSCCRCLFLLFCSFLIWLRTTLWLQSKFYSKWCSPRKLQSKICLPTKLFSRLFFLSTVTRILFSFLISAIRYCFINDFTGANTALQAVPIVVYCIHCVETNCSWWAIYLPYSAYGSDLIWFWLKLTWLDLTWLDLTWLDLTWLDLTDLFRFDLICLDWHIHLLSSLAMGLCAKGQLNSTSKQCDHGPTSWCDHISWSPSPFCLEL